MYHSITDTVIAPFVDPDNSITLEEFEAQLALIHKSCEIISLTKLLSCLRENKSIPPNTVVITFDDGYLDNLTNAAPLLARYQMPATLFLTTAYVESAEPQWIDHLYSMFQFRSLQVLAPECLRKDFDLEDHTQVVKVYELIKKMLVQAGPAERKDILQEVETQLEPTLSPPPLTLNWNDVRRLKEDFPLFDIGVHTRNHVDISMLADKQAEDEIRYSVQDYKNELDSVPCLFSYPYGRHNKRTRNCVKKLNFSGAVVTQPTYRIEKSSDCFALPRYSCTSSLLDLKIWLSGAMPELSILLWGRAYD